MKEFKHIMIWLAVGIATVAFALQYNSIRQMRSELAELRSRLMGTPPTAGPSAREIVIRNDAPADQRLTQLERTVAELARASEHLKARGQLPLVAQDIDAARARFLDPTLSDRDRLRALELLRRNGPLPDDLALSAMSWVQSSTNAAMRRSLLQQLDGATNAVLKQPLLQLAASEQDSGARANKSSRICAASSPIRRLNPRSGVCLKTIPMRMFGRKPSKPSAGDRSRRRASLRSGIVRSIPKPRSMSASWPCALWVAPM